MVLRVRSKYDKHWFESWFCLLFKVDVGAEKEILNGSHEGRRQRKHHVGDLKLMLVAFPN